MTIVAPSILSADFGRLGEEVRGILDEGADWVHVDVMDGRFVPNLTIGPPVVAGLRKHAPNAFLDTHLMIVEPDRLIADFRAAGSDQITVHVEACTHLHRTIQAIKALGAKAGVSLNPATPPESLDYILEDVDLVLVMSVNPGFGGQSLIESSFRKIAAIRQRIDKIGSAALIEVDGGIKPDNAWRFVEVGAHALVSGSGVFGAKDRAAAIRGLREAKRP